MAALLAGAGAAIAQGTPDARDAARPVPATACPQAVDVTQAHLLGLWRAEFDGLWQGATLLFEPHLVYAQSISGAINRNGERGMVVGDIEEGEFTLEESADGKRIAATWLGDVVEGSCGREIRGTWQATGEKSAREFILRKR